MHERAKAAMRSAMFEDGPYGYPVQKYAMKTLLGGYIVQVDGTGDEPGKYMEAIIACAVRSGLIAKRIDPATLDTPPPVE